MWSLLKRRWVRLTLAISLTLGFIILWATSLQRSTSAIQAYEWTLVPGWAIVALVLYAIGFCLLPLGSQVALGVFGHHANYGWFFRVYFIAQMAKYLPGGLWIVPGRLVLYKQRDVSLAVGTVAVFLELSFLIISGLLMFLVGGVPLWWGKPEVSYLAFGGMAALACIVHPAILSQLLTWALRLLRRPVAKVKLDALSVVRLLGVGVSFWGMMGAAFYALLRATEFDGTGAIWLLPMWAGIFALSWVAGFLVFVLPAGLGPRESVLLLLLNPILPAPLPLLLPLLARLGWTLAEGGCIMAAGLFIRSGRNVSRTSD